MPGSPGCERVLLPNRAWLDRHSQEFIYVYGKIPQDIYKNIARYWAKRHKLFSKFDEGIFMNEELWYSVTPEAMAIFVAKFIKACDPSIKSVLDVFCGGGGNLIQFARFFDEAYGVEYNEMNLYCAERNCEVYGVLDKVGLKLGSWTDLIGSKYYRELHGQIDFIFSSPPWGGPSYKHQTVYDLERDLQPLGLRELLGSFFAITPNVALFLPKNSDWDQLSEVTRELLGNEAKCRILFISDHNRCKGILAFWGEKFQATDYDYEQELMPMQHYYYMAAHHSHQFDNENMQGRDTMEDEAVSIMDTYERRYPGRANDNKRNDRYSAGDYADDFYDEKEDGEDGPKDAWFDSNAKKWYSYDQATGETYYVTEDENLPIEGYVVADNAWDYGALYNAKYDEGNSQSQPDNKENSEEINTREHYSTHDLDQPSNANLDSSESKYESASEGNLRSFSSAEEDESEDFEMSSDDGPPEESSSKPW